MEILNVEEVDNGSNIIEFSLTEEERNIFISYAINDILRKQVEKAEKEYKLLPCPFCGEPGELFLYCGDDEHFEKLYQSGCKSGHKMDYIGSKRECVDHWNKRKTMDEFVPFGPNVYEGP
jgi:hypothetical protein